MLLECLTNHLGRKLRLEFLIASDLLILELDFFLEFFLDLQAGLFDGNLLT